MIQSVLAPMMTVGTLGVVIYYLFNYSETDSETSVIILESGSSTCTNVRVRSKVENAVQRHLFLINLLIN